MILRLMTVSGVLWAAGTSTSPVLPLSFVEMSKGDIYTWEQVTSGSATLAVWNDGPRPIKIDAALTRFYSYPAGTENFSRASLQPRISPASKEVPPRELTPLVLAVDQDAGPGYYTGFILLTAEKLPPVRHQIWITGPAPELLVSKMTMILKRCVPGSALYRSRELEVPFRAAYSGTAGAIAGGIQNDMGAWTRVRWKAPSKLEVDPPPAGKFTGDIGFGIAPNKATLSLTVLVQDILFWPIFTIAVGITLAFVAKRYLGVLRVVWSLREQSAEAKERYWACERSFRAAAAGTTFAGYSIATDFETRETAVNAALDRLSRPWCTGINPSNADYTSAVSGLTGIGEGLAAWCGIAEDFRTLQETLDTVQSAIGGAAIFPASLSKSVPAFVTVGQKLLTGRGQVTLGALTGLKKNAADLTALAKEWIDAAQNLSAITSDFQALTLPEHPDPDQRKAINAFETRLDGAWRDLFALKTSADLDSLTAIHGVIASARVGLDELGRELSPAMMIVPRRFGSPGPSAATLPLRMVRPRPGAKETADSDTRKAEMLRRAIARGDTASVLFAGIIALLTGLNTYYFGKPFGTGSDYLGLFLWAAGTKVALDIVAGVVDQLTAQKLAKNS